jgi:hypothetical protein
MRRRRGIQAAAEPLLAVVLCLTVLCPCGCKTGSVATLPAVQKIGQATGLQPGDEEQIAAVLDDVCRGYRDAEGRDYEALRAYLDEVFKKYALIRITRVPPRITLNKDRARAIETFGTAAEPQDRTHEPPVNLQGRVAVDLVKTQGQWRIVEWGHLL